MLCTSLGAPTVTKADGILVTGFCLCVCVVFVCVCKIHAFEQIDSLVFYSKYLDLNMIIIYRIQLHVYKTLKNRRNRQQGAKNSDLFFFFASHLVPYGSG